VVLLVAIYAKAGRESTGLTQPAFAARIATPVATLRDWEQGRYAPPGGVLCLLRLIVRHPELVREIEAA
jgi:putative transcriptional regulator